MLQAAVSGVCRDADDLEDQRFAVDLDAAADGDVTSDRIRVAEVGPGEELAHHGDGQRSLRDRAP